MSDKSYKGDIGTVVTVNCGSNISTATIHNLLVKKPNGSIVTWSGTVYNNNYIRHTIVAGDIDQPGTYYLQSYIELPTWKGRGETVLFTIYGFFE